MLNPTLSSIMSMSQSTFPILDSSVLAWHNKKKNGILKRVKLKDHVLNWENNDAIFPFKSLKDPEGTAATPFK